MDIVFAFVCAEEELSIEELHPDDGEDELKEEIDDEDVEDVLQGDDDTVKDSLQLRHSVDGLQSQVEKSKPLEKCQDPKFARNKESLKVGSLTSLWMNFASRCTQIVHTGLL